jgi:hypothetical protein
MSHGVRCLFKFEVSVFRLVRKITEATVSFIMSVCLSLHMEQIGSHGMEFHEIRYARIFRKSF